jgi:long-chain acyl-CoA synthetase
MSIKTLSELFLVAVGHQKPNCLLHKVDGRFRPVTTAELHDRVLRLAAALRALGVERGDRVGLMAENGPHWPTVDFATLGIGAVLVPVYPTLTPDQASYVINDCGAEVVFVQGEKRLEGLLGEKSAMPNVHKLILIEGQPPSSEIDSFDRLLEETAPMDEGQFEESARSASADDLATFIYTSGTTGNPKGVMLTHGNIASNVVNALKVLDIHSEWTALSFLPLSHSFERMVDYIYFYRGATIAYAESIQAVAKNFQEVNPHVFVSVPRVYEKVLAKVRENVAASPPLKQKIFGWAVGDPALAGRQVGLWQDQGAAWQPLPVRHVGRCAAGPRSGGVLLGNGDRDLRGIRPIGDLARIMCQQSRCREARDRRSRDSGRGAQDRRRW